MIGPGGDGDASPRNARQARRPGAAVRSASLPAARGQDADPLKIPDTQLEPLAFSALDGWDADDHIASFSAFLKSCAPFLANNKPR